MRKLILLSLLCLPAFCQVAVFPGAVATDSQLMVAANLLTTKLVTPLGATDASLVVASNAGFAASMLVTVDTEIIKISGIVGSNVLTVAPGGRGFDGSAAISHPFGKQVSVFLDAWHHNAMSLEMQATQGALGANLSNIPGTASGPVVPVNKGGTGATTPPAALAALGVTLPLPVVLGGTGAITGPAALTALGVTFPVPVAQGGTGITSAQGAGTGTKVQLATGSTTSGHLAKYDSSGALIDAGAPPGSSTAFFNVKDAPFNAVGDGITDDTAAIQSAINAARTLLAGPACGPGINAAASVHFPAGSYAISSLDLTRTCGLELIGIASWSVSLYGYKQSGISKPMLDMTGCSSCNVRGMTVNGQQQSGAPPAIIPSVGVLMASTSAGGDCNKDRLDDVGILGHFITAALYIYACTDNTFVGDGHQSWHNGTPVLWIDGGNGGAVSSPYQTIATGSQPTGEMTFLQNEFHDLARDAFGVAIVPSTTQTVRIVNAYALRFYGGNISNSAGPFQGFVHFEGSAIRDLIFDGQEYYGDQGVSLGPIFYNNGANVQSLSVRMPYIANTTIPAVIGGAANSSYTGLELRGIDADYAGTPISMPDAASSATYTILDAILDLGGKGFKPGGAIKNVLLLNPGTITLRAGGANWDNVTPAATFTFAGKPLFSVPGSQIFVSDGASPSSPCTGSSTGALATWQNSALKCY